MLSPIDLCWTYEQNGFMKELPQQKLFVSRGLPVVVFGLPQIGGLRVEDGLRMKTRVVTLSFNWSLSRPGR